MTAKEYPFGKYSLVQYCSNMEYTTPDVPHIFTFYFDYMEKKGYMKSEVQLFWDDDSPVEFPDEYSKEFRDDCVFFCEMYMEKFGNWSKLYLWNPETNSHDILIGVWK